MQTFTSGSNLCCCFCYWQGMIWGTFGNTTPICWMIHSGLVENTRESSSSPPTWWESNTPPPPPVTTITATAHLSSWGLNGKRLFFIQDMICWNRSSAVFPFLMKCWWLFLSLWTFCAQFSHEIRTITHREDFSSLTVSFFCLFLFNSPECYQLFFKVRQEDVSDIFNQQGHRPRLPSIFWGLNKYKYFIPLKWAIAVRYPLY